MSRNKYTKISYSAQRTIVEHKKFEKKKKRKRQYIDIDIVKFFKIFLFQTKIKN